MGTLPLLEIPGPKTMSNFPNFYIKRQKANDTETDRSDGKCKREKR
jgi:hypothetical protein